MKIRGDFTADRRLVQLSLIALVIGAVCAYVAVALLAMIRFFTNLFFFQQISLMDHSPAQNTLGAWMILVPVAGALVIGLMARYGSEKIRGHGIPEALEAILFGGSLMKPKVAILKPISSAISIGSGGPFGAEGPIIMTGGAFGSIISQFFRLSAGERKTLLVSGAAAGMAAVFSSPIAAVLLAVELLLFEWRPRSLVPVALASAVAAALRTHLMGSGPLFPVPAHPMAQGWELLVASVIGIVAGALSMSLSNLLYKLEDAFHHLPIHWMWWPALGGLVVGLGGYFEPRALGVGYDVIGDLLQNRMVGIGVVLPFLAVKCGIWVVSLASGTSGGVLAPLLMMGAGLGSVLGTFLPPSQEVLWPLVGMASILGGMMRAPFTAVVFALELTHDVSALRPLLMGAVCAYAFTVLTMKRSILTEKIARRGFDIFREYTVDPLERLRVREVMTCEVISVPSGLSAKEAFDRYFAPGRKHRGYPVITGSGEPIGMLTSANFLLAQESEPTSLRVDDIASRGLVTVLPDQSCRIAAELMARNGVGRLIVIDPASRGLIGIITRSDLLKSRSLQLEEEAKYERLIKVT